MTHYKTFSESLALVLALGALSGASAQDRGDANAQASMKALRPSVPGVHGLVTSAHPLASMAGHAHSARRRQRVRRRCRRGSGPERGRAAELEHRGQRLCHDVRQEDRPGALAGHGRSGAQGSGRVGDDAGDPEHGDEARRSCPETSAGSSRCSTASAPEASPRCWRRPSSMPSRDIRPTTASPPAFAADRSCCRAPRRARRSSCRAASCRPSGRDGSKSRLREHAQEDGRGRAVGDQTRGDARSAR